MTVLGILLLLLCYRSVKTDGYSKFHAFGEKQPVNKIVDVEMTILVAPEMDVGGLFHMLLYMQVHFNLTRPIISCSIEVSLTTPEDKTKSLPLSSLYTPSLTVNLCAGVFMTFTLLQFSSLRPEDVLTFKLNVPNPCGNHYSTGISIFLPNDTPKCFEESVRSLPRIECYDSGKQSYSH